MPRKLLVTVLLLAGLAGIAAGQTTFATITGTVTDPNGLAVPGAAVEATHQESNYRYTAQSNAVGAYTLGQLREGTYRVRVTASGFSEVVVSDVLLSARDIRRVDARLELGTVQAVVEVKGGGATLIETETARINDVKSADLLRSLPLATRRAMDFVQQTPGILRGSGGAMGYVIHFSGSRSNQEDQTIDGISFNNGRDGTYIGVLGGYMESVAEVRIDMANNTAELGSLGQFTFVTKSGGNQLHGSVLDYYTSTNLNARNPFAPVQESMMEHRPGISVSGPVFLPKIYNGRNKTFFFFSYETRRGSGTADLINPTVAPASWRAGDFSSLLPKTVVRDPFSKLPFANNTIPASRISSVSGKLQERFWPLPNYGDTTVLEGSNYREVRRRPYDPAGLYTVRLDHRFNPKSFAFGRYTYGSQMKTGYEGNLPTIGQLWNPRTTPSFNGSYSYMASPNLLNEVRIGFSFNDNPRHGPVRGLPLVKELGLVGLVDNLPDDYGIFNVSFSGIGLTGISQTGTRDPGFRNRVYQFQDHLSWFRGRHSLKAGVQVSRIGFAERNLGGVYGRASFSNRFTNHPYADFLLGIPTSSSRAWPGLTVDQSRYMYDLFLTDELKVNSHLTLNLGLRYELHPTWYTNNRLESIFDVATGRVVIANGSMGKVNPLMPRGYVEVVEARDAGYPDGRLLRTDTNNFAPRFGFAYRPWGNRTVFRGGFGIYYDVTPRGASAAKVPFDIAEPAFNNPADNPLVIFPRVFPASGVAGPPTVTLPGAKRGDLRIPYSMQYSFTIEHQRWGNGFRLSYVGTGTRQTEYEYNINQPVPDARRFIDKPRPFPNFPNIDYMTNGAGHQYHAMTAQVRRAMSNGLSYHFSFELSRDIGDLERGQAPENAFDLRRERAVMMDIPTRRITSHVVYDLPFGRGKPWLAGSNRVVRAVAGNWQLSAIYDMHSGQFLTPSWTGPDPVGIVYTTSKTPAQVSLRPNHLRDANLPADQRTTNRWFDPTAFAPPEIGSFGSAAKGVIKGPGVNTFHAGLAKEFRIAERAGLQLQIQATNLFNHPNWDNPNTNITNVAKTAVISGVGTVSQFDQGAPRQLMFGVRLQW